MCGIVGLHLRNPELHPQLGELLTGMLCEMADRGTDSAGVAVYGDPSCHRRGHGCVSLLDVGASADEVAAAARRAAPAPSTVTPDRRDVSAVRGGRTPRLCWPRRVRRAPGAVTGFGGDLTVLKGVGHPRELADGWGLPAASGLAGRRAHPDGHRIGGDTGGCSPLRRRTATSAWCTTARSPTTPPSAVN